MTNTANSKPESVYHPVWTEAAERLAVVELMRHRGQHKEVMGSIPDVGPADLFKLERRPPGMPVDAKWFMFIPSNDSGLALVVAGNGDLFLGGVSPDELPHFDAGTLISWLVTFQPERRTS